MIKEPKNFNDILELQAILDNNNINNKKERTTEDIKLSLITEIIGFNEETEYSNKTCKTKEFDKKIQLEKLADILFFIAEWVNYKKENNLTLPELHKLNEIFESEKEISSKYKRNHLLNLISVLFNGLLVETSVLYYYTSLVANYGFTNKEILKCYFNKWQEKIRETDNK